MGKNSKNIFYLDLGIFNHNMFQPWLYFKGTAANRRRRISSLHYPATPLILLPSFSNPARAGAFVSAIMALQLNPAQHILIKSLLKEARTS
jgi:hypothetical protein